MQNWPFYFLVIIAALRLGALDLLRMAWRRVRRPKRVVPDNVIELAARRRS